MPHFVDRVLFSTLVKNEGFDFIRVILGNCILFKMCEMKGFRALLEDVREETHVYVPLFINHLLKV